MASAPGEHPRSWDECLQGYWEVEGRHHYTVFDRVWYVRFPNGWKELLVLAKHPNERLGKLLATTRDGSKVPVSDLKSLAYKEVQVKQELKSKRLQRLIEMGRK